MVAFRAIIVYWVLVGFAGHANASDQLSSEDFLLGVGLGISHNQVDTLLEGGDSSPAFTSDWQQEAMLAFSAHYPFAERHELGMQLQYGNIDGEGLGVLRLLDYRYRLLGTLRLKTFFGIARYDLATPAHGYYLGAGLESRFFDEHLGITIEGAYGDKIARDRVLPSDPPPTITPEVFYDISAINAYITWYF
jgi:hypothetical protein